VPLGIPTAPSAGLHPTLHDEEPLNYSPRPLYSPEGAILIWPIPTMDRQPSAVLSDVFAAPCNTVGTTVAGSVTAHEHHDSVLL
jgi:hypothetical protein